MEHRPIPCRATSIHRSSLRPVAVLSSLLAVFPSARMDGRPTNNFLNNGPKRSAMAIARSASAANPTANPAIFLHGTMGSHLVDGRTGRFVWGEFSDEASNGHDPAAIRGMSLPMERGRPLSALRDHVYPASNLNRIGLRVLPGIRLDIGYYEDAMERFGEAVNGTSDQSAAAPGRARDRYLQFCYDWRRSCDENAARLARFIEDRKAEFVRRHGYPESMKFDVIAHSQGALVLRYYLRFGDQPLPRDGSQPRLTWEGASNVENVVLLGPPNAGVGETINYLTHGHRVEALLPRYEAAVVGTMPAIYQMLPRARDGALLDPETGTSLDPLDFNLWVRKEWGLANPEQDETLQILLPDVHSAGERRTIALDHLRKCLASAAQLQDALDRPARKPRHLHIAVCAGETKKTPATFLAIPREPKLHRRVSGDGTVALYSARRCGADETNVFRCNHTDLACKKKVNHHVIGLLVSER